MALSIRFQLNESSEKNNEHACNISDCKYHFGRTLEDKRTETHRIVRESEGMDLVYLAQDRDK